MSAQDFLHKVKKNTGTLFHCLYITFALHKTESDPTLSVMMNQKRRIENKPLLVQTHACFDSRSKITNQSHSTTSFNVLATRGRRLGVAIQKPNTN